MAGARVELTLNSLRMAFINFLMIFIFIFLLGQRRRTTFSRIAPHACVAAHAGVTGRLTCHAILASQTLGNVTELAGIAIFARGTLGSITSALAAVAKFARLALA
jgi:hypothetical protein